MHLHHLAIQVFDLERAAKFYQGLFSLPELRRQAHSIWLDLNGAILMLEKCSQEATQSPWKSDAPGLFVLALKIEASERQVFREKLRSMKIEISHETGSTMYFKDPDGNRLAVSHYPTPER